MGCDVGPLCNNKCKYCFFWKEGKCLYHKIGVDVAVRETLFIASEEVSGD